MIYFYGVSLIVYIIIGSIVREVIRDDLDYYESFLEFFKDKDVGGLILLLIFLPVYAIIELLFEFCNLVDKMISKIFNSKIMKHKPFKRG